MNDYCFSCYGRGTRQEARQELDVAMGFAVGMPFSTFMPMYRTVYHTVPCTACAGTGKKRK